MVMKLTLATVMPHALFLGSSLAGIDRLDMMPRRPTPESDTATTAKKLPFGLRRRLNRQTTVSPVEEETIEMKSYDPPARGDGTPHASADHSEDVIAQLDHARERSGQNSDYDAAFKKYEADLKNFDRIRWTDLHIRHATVSPSSCYSDICLC